MNALIVEERKKYHQSLLDNGVLTIDKRGIPSNADSSSKLSIAIAKGITDRLMAETHEKAVGQTSGAKFEQINMEFLAATFPKLKNIRPGKWHIVKLGNRNAMKTSSFVQYEHLDYLTRLLAYNRQLAASMGNDYMVALKADIRQRNGGLPIPHASISAKWTMRSDRAQNSRTEALNLIRNRKGHLPHIVVVTGEPLPSRLASLALGTGDIDCMYHFALYELMESVEDTGAEDSIEMLKSLIEGKRLKDISDLPLDLCV